MIDDGWIYYAQRYANGIHVFFREAAGRPDEAYHRQRGWIASSELFYRRRKGEVDQADLVTRERAEQLIRDEPSPLREGFKSDAGQAAAAPARRAGRSSIWRLFARLAAPVRRR